MNRKYTRLRFACYTASMTMAVAANLSPLLFLTFREMYGVSYSLLGLLVVINFTTQLGIDLVFSFFSHRFNIPLTVKLIPVIAAAGLIIYALSPFIFPGMVYLGILLSTVIFSAASGLAEVLISPVIAAIPSENPDHEMSKLHSMYAWGTVGVVVISTVFLLIFGKEKWQFLALFFALVPLTSAFLYAGSKIPEMETPEKASGAVAFLKNKTLWACLAAIFIGGASECTMGQWASGYIEQALGLPKVVGDICGVAMFAVTLGLGRSLYAKYGKNISKMLLICLVSTCMCYFVAAVSPVPILGLLACALCGCSTSMLWPGNLIVADERFPNGGVMLYALMAAGGDLGASVVPQILGSVTDIAIANPTIISIAEKLALTPDQLGMKLAMFVGMIFPLIGIPLYVKFYKDSKKKAEEK